ncbi:type I restriction enzyme endonuclease domain-containing protein [Nostoc sp.]|uniref:type I restriction enzyme endonuclease domain-containing protein n=1 Tax=Nostoc sp. TaxID=1180 RepID=UPI002FFA7A7B
MGKHYWFNSPPYGTFKVGLFQAIRTTFVKHATAGGNSPEDLDSAIRQIVYNAVATVQMVNIFAAAGIHNP